MLSVFAYLEKRSRKESLPSYRWSLYTGDATRMLHRRSSLPPASPCAREHLLLRLHCNAKRPLSGVIQVTHHRPTRTTNPHQGGVGRMHGPCERAALFAFPLLWAAVGRRGEEAALQSVERASERFVTSLHLRTAPSLLAASNVASACSTLLTSLFGAAK